MIGVFFIGISGVKASFTITYEGDNTKVLNNAILDSLIKTHFRLTDDNRTVYCYDGYVSYLEQTATYDSCQTVTTNTAELAYIFENGYGRNNNYSIGNKYDDYFITQIAVWYFAGRTNTEGEDLLEGFDTSGGRLTGTFRGKSNTLTQKVAEFVNDTLDISSNYSLSLTASNKELTATSDGKYYISDPIKISGTNVANTVSVTVTGATGAFVTTNKDATSGSSSFALGNTIYIKVPIASVGTNTSIKLSASAKSTVAKGTLTRCVNSVYYAYQGLVDYTEGSKPTASANLTFTASKIINVTISKRSVTGTDELPGATLVIKKGDNVVKTITSTTSSTSVTLDPGEYTLEETVAPDGYIRNTEKITFVVADDGKVTIDGKEVSEVVMKNEPIIVYISKKSINGKTELPGATLTITDKDGKIVKDLDGQELTWKSTTEQKKFHLAAGTYYLSEKIAPKGYELSETVLEFTVTSDGKVKMDKKDVDNNLIVYTNTPEAEEVKTGSFLIYIIVIGTIATGLITYFVMKKGSLSNSVGE